MAINDYYIEQIMRVDLQKKPLAKLSNRAIWGKIASFCTAAFCEWHYFANDNNVPGVVGIIGLLAYIAFVIYDSRLTSSIAQLSEKLIFYKNELSNLDGNFTHADGEEYADGKHSYSGDLDIFGKASLFQRINRTITSVGSDRLAERLTSLSIDDTWEERKVSIAELTDNTSFVEAFAILPKVTSRIHLNAYTPHTIHGEKAITIAIKSLRYAMVGLLAYMVVAILFNLPTAIVGAIAGLLFTLQLLATFLFNRKMDITYRQSSILIKEYAAYMPILDTVSEQTFKSPYLRSLQSTLNGFIADTKQAQSMESVYALRANPIMWLFLNGLFLIDISSVMRFNSWAKARYPHIPELESCIAELDSLVSIAHYNFNHPDHCLASTTDKSLISITNGYHPFMEKSESVANSFKITPQTTSIITGANMSGKSTFLRAIALNIVLAKAGCVCSADAFEFNPKVSIFTSMRVRDDVNTGTSFFKSEINRVSQMLDYIASNSNTIVMLDEVLRGTNSDDKLHGTLTLLNHLADKQATVIIATHDVAVAKLEAENSTRYHNYCFEITLGNPPQYPYTISDGVCKNKNATYLLEQILTK